MKTDSPGIGIECVVTTEAVVRNYRETVLRTADRLPYAEPGPDARSLARSIIDEVVAAIPVVPSEHWELARRWRLKPWSEYVRYLDRVYAVARERRRGSETVRVTALGVFRISIDPAEIGFEVTCTACKRYAEKVLGREESSAWLSEPELSRIRTAIAADIIQEERRLELDERFAFADEGGLDPRQEFIVCADRVYAVWNGSLVKTVLVPSMMPRLSGLIDVIGSASGPVGEMDDPGPIAIADEVMPDLVRVYGRRESESYLKMVRDSVRYGVKVKDPLLTIGQSAPHGLDYRRDGQVILGLTRIGGTTRLTFLKMLPEGREVA